MLDTKKPNTFSDAIACFKFSASHVVYVDNCSAVINSYKLCLLQYDFNARRMALSSIYVI